MNRPIHMALALANLVLVLVIPGCSKNKGNLNNHYQAAHELAELEYGPQRMTLITAASVSEMIKDGSIKPSQESQYREWITETMSDKEFINEVAKIEMNNYTEKEIRDFIAFYHTPSGQRMLLVEPLIANALKAVSDKNTQKHLPALTSKYLVQPQGH